jgi:hypothetical protein
MMGRVTRNLGSSVTPMAVRVTRPGWRDPRLWIGILIVCVSVVAGARVLAGADDTVGVWAAARDIGAGDDVTADDLVVRRVRFADGTDLDAYFAADEAVPGDQQLVRGVGAGELLPRSAVGPAGGHGLLQLPLAVDPEQLPPSVGAGSVVDVYLVPTAGSACRACDGRPVLSAVPVVDASAVDEGFATSGKSQLVLGVEPDDATAFFRALGGSDGPTITVVRRG